jgi:hypothetical protein
MMRSIFAGHLDSKMTSESLHAMADRWPGLELLDLARCKKISTEGLEAGVASCHSMKHLGMSCHSGAVTKTYKHNTNKEDIPNSSHLPFIGTADTDT